MSYNESVGTVPIHGSPSTCGGESSSREAEYVRNVKSEPAMRFQHMDGE